MGDTVLTKENQYYENYKIWCKEKDTHVSKNTCKNEQTQNESNCFWCAYYGREQSK